MNYDEYTTRDLRLELETERVKADRNSQLAIENELLKREQAFLKYELKESEPETILSKVGRVFKYGFVTISIIIGLLIYFDVIYLEAKGGGSQIDRVKADALAKKVVLKVSNDPIVKSIELFNPNFSKINVSDLSTNIDMYRRTYEGSPEIIKFELEERKILSGSRNPDYVYLYNMVVNYKSKSVALRVVIAFKGDVSYVRDFRVIKDRPLLNPNSA